MADARPSQCKRCAKGLSQADYAENRAMVLLGAGYCSVCLEILTPTCRLCRKSVHESDFAQGRALTLQGVRYCEGCLEQAVRTTETSTVPVEKPHPDWKSRRASIRFVPPQDCEVILKRSGLKGFLSTNIVKLLVDVSEGGLRAVVQGRYEVGDLLQGKLLHPELDEKLDFQGMVRHAKPSERFVGCTLVGIRFEEPSSLFKAFIRDVLGRRQGIMPLSPPTPKPRPSSARSA